MSNEQKKQVLTNIIINGLFYSPIIEWDDDGSPYIGNEEKTDEVFSNLSELAAVMRELADDLDK